MFRHCATRRLTLLVILLVLALPLTAPAAPLTHAEPATSSLTRLWSWLSSLLGENGCIADPWGSGCKAASASTDNGCAIDPGGRCKAALALPTSDNGCLIDPWGRCGG